MDNRENSAPPPRGRGRGGRPRLNQRPAAATPTPDHGAITEARRTRRQRMEQSNTT